MEKRAYQIGGILFLLAVAIGAFAAHGLEDLLIENQRSKTFETGVKYHFYHSIAILILGIVSSKYSKINLKPVISFFLIGIVLFSGSLYALSITNAGFLGAITPFGGTAFIIGWLIFLFKISKIDDLRKSAN